MHLLCGGRAIQAPEARPGGNGHRSRASSPLPPSLPFPLSLFPSHSYTRNSIHLSSDQHPHHSSTLTMSPSPFTLVSLLALALSRSVSAAPFPLSGLGERSAADGVEPAFMRRSFDLVARLDYQPAITYPTADTVWTAGQKVNVTW